jgi:uncharacterized membrane protein YeiH
VRDILTARTPIVLTSEIYAVAALAGAAIVATGELVGLSAGTTLPAGIGLCFFLRIMAIYRGWTLPVFRAAKDGPNT